MTSPDKLALAARIEQAGGAAFPIPGTPLKHPLGPAQVDLLKRIVATNGGGIPAIGLDRRIVQGLVKRHLVQGKTGSPERIVHTRAGLAFCRALASTEDRTP